MKAFGIARVDRRLRLALGLTALVAGSAAAQETGISGRVTDASSGEPVPAVQVTIVGTNLTTITNNEGAYTIQGVSAGPVTVRVARIGYGEAAQEVAVTAGEVASVDFALDPTPVTLDPVVTTATGVQRRIEVGNSIARVDASELVETRAISSMADLLTARAPGVLTFPGTQTGAGVRIRVRGVSSISLSNNPIFIVDGIRVNGETGSASIGVGGTTPARVNDLNPAEIQSIEVVRGPSASTLYGTDAANGVIVITTKRGVAGRPQWSYSMEQTAITDRNDYPTAYHGWTEGSAPSNLTQCFLAQAAAGACAQDSVTAYNLHDDPESTPYGVGYRQQHTLRVSGGSDVIRYSLQGGWEDEDGRLKIPEFDQRWLAARDQSLLPGQRKPNHMDRISARANVDVTLPGNADITLSTGYTQEGLRLPMSDDSGFNGVAPGTYGGPGFKYNINSAGDTLYGWRSFTPRDIYQRVTAQEVNRVISSVSANWRPLESVALRGTFGVDYINRQETQICRFENCPDQGENRLGFKRDNRTNMFQYTGDLAATVIRAFGDGIESRTTAGAQFFRSVFNRNGAFGSILPPGATTVTAGAVQSAEETSSESRTLGGFLEQHLAIDDRLFLTGAVRSDRNSAFGADFKTVFYPKLSASWVVSQEGFFPAIGWLNELRLRGAYGASGVQPGTTAAAEFFSPSDVLLESGDEPAVIYTALGNRELKPERSAEVELGLDATFWNNRVSAEVTYYNKNSRDALISRILPPSIGTGNESRLENLGEVRNWGWEALVNAQLIDHPAFGWDVLVNGAANNNELVDLGGVPPIIGTTQEHREGFPLFGFWSRRLISWEDKSGDGRITYDEDPELSEIVVGDEPEFIGYSAPRLEITVTNGVDLWQRRLRLAAMIDYKGGHTVYNNSERIRCANRNNCSGLINPESSLFEQARTVAVRDHPSRTVAGFFEDGDFIRFRELSLTFSAPREWASRLFRGERLVLSLAARNLGMLWTKYTGVDPEAFGSTGDRPSSFQAFGPPTYYSLNLSIGF